MNPALMLDVVRFELARSLTVGRIAIWFVLTAFPIFLSAGIRVIAQVAQANGGQIHPEEWGLTLYFMTEVICLLSLLLWATPVISTEIEGQTWIYLAMRRSGRSMVLLGKYLTAIIWTLAATLISVTVCSLIMAPFGGFRLWSVMCIVTTLSVVSHAALYLLIGTLFFKRTMVTAVFYTLTIEWGMSFVPALANKITINYRLRGLLADWMNWEEVRSQAETIFGNEPAWTHLLVLFAITVTLIGVALFRMGHSEFPTVQEA